jgi:hypothetical protein
MPPAARAFVLGCLAAGLLGLAACRQPKPAPPPEADAPPPFKHYLAAVLTAESQQKLVAAIKAKEKIPSGWTWVAHHMTVAPPGDDAYLLPREKGYPVPLGGKVALTAREYARDSKGCAAAVTSSPPYAELRGTNKHPHVTVAHGPGGSAFYSNALLAKPGREPLTPPLELEARLCVVSSDSKTTIPELPGLARDLRSYHAGLFRRLQPQAARHQPAFGGLEEPLREQGHGHGGQGAFHQQQVVVALQPQDDEFAVAARADQPAQGGKADVDHRRRLDAGQDGP